jgi:hypothetical protein
MRRAMDHAQFERHEMQFETDDPDFTASVMCCACGGGGPPIYSYTLQSSASFRCSATDSVQVENIAKVSLVEVLGVNYGYDGL